MMKAHRASLSLLLLVSLILLSSTLILFPLTSSASTQNTNIIQTGLQFQKGHNGGGGSTCPTISGADTSVCSTNWSGYADTGSSVSAVSGTWTVPKLSCPSRGTTYVAIWVGIDGYSSSTVEQTGILGLCSGGKPSYSAWYEFYPASSVTISGFTVKPGDTVSASVTYSSTTSLFTTTITDGSQTHSTSGSVSGAARSSAEWIVERPEVCSGFRCSLTTLSNFGSVPFTSGTATIGTSTGSISAFSDVAITMVGSSSVLAEPSSLDSTGTSFSVAYG